MGWNRVKFLKNMFCWRTYLIQVSSILFSYCCSSSEDAHRNTHGESFISCLGPKTISLQFNFILRKANMGLELYRNFKLEYLNVSDTRNRSEEGKCVRLREGKMEEETIFSDDPISTAASWFTQVQSYRIWLI